jgi:enamine deaminase RidA (YjgF/YER057c/UK114 family)
MDIDQKLKSLKVIIPDLGKPVGLYVPAVKTGNLVYTSGQLPFADGRLIFNGRVGKDVTPENAQRAAKAALVNALAAIKWVIGDLTKIKKIIRLNGFVCSAIGYNDQAKIMNAASELLIQIFGDEVGNHSRVTVGCLELPMGACVEVDLIVEVATKKI